MRKPSLAFALAFLAGCSLSLGLNGDANRPCQDSKCLDGYVCRNAVCVPLVGGSCKVGNDCPSGYCVDGGCELAPCKDAKVNFRETDVDCGGGFCGKCQVGKGCAHPWDCVPGVCERDGGADAGDPDGGLDAGADAGLGGTCSAPSCLDTVLNGSETDVDCGGDAGCPKCANGLLCKVGPDCVTGSCAGVCQPGACIDLLYNGMETDVDCGGPCMKCLNGKNCLLAKDCVSGVCFSAKCAVPTCTDLVKNGAESDVDCGASGCAGCAEMKACSSNANCASAVCQSAKCRPARCANGAKDGDESDNDCGGSCQKCDLGKKCNGDADCDSNNCWSAVDYCIP